MRSVLTLVLATSACGRIGFDPSGDSPADAAACVPVNGLLAYWPMDTNDVVGTTVFDRSGNSFNGTINGSPAPTVSAGEIGEALDFSGATATTPVYVDFTGMTFDATPGAAITVAMWAFRATSPTPNDSPIYVPLNPKYDLYYVDNDVCINTGNGDCWGVTDPTIASRWVHVAAVFANGPTIDSQLYIDGVRRTSSCTPETGFPCNASATVRAPLYLGGGDVYQWYGKLDEVRVYDHALSQGETQHVYDGTLCPP